MPESVSTLEEFLREDRRKLVLYLLYLGLRFDEAEDAAADTYERLWRERAWVTSRKQWCRTTAYRLAIDVYRANQRAYERDEALRREYGSGLVTGAEDLVMLREEHRRVVARLRGLPWKQRETFALHLDGLANVQIAELLGAKESTVASNIRHAKIALRAMLEEDKVYDSGRAERGDSDELRPRA